MMTKREALTLARQITGKDSALRADLQRKRAPIGFGAGYWCYSVFVTDPRTGAMHLYTSPGEAELTP